MAIQSVVPHQHPAWTGAVVDEVYKLGQSHWEEDQKLFERRCAQFLGLEPADA